MVTAAFVVVALLLALAVLAAVLRPLWPQSSRLGLGVAAVAAACAVLGYFLVGTPAALDQRQRTPPATLGDAIALLRAELARDPDRAEDWVLLARAHVAEDQPLAARDAFARALALAPDRPDLLVETAQARALADSGRRFDDEAVELLHRALVLQPEHLHARLLLGVSERQRGRYETAARIWETLLAHMSAEAAADLREQIAQARERGTGAGPPPMLADGRLQLIVEIEPELQAQLGSGDSLFVFAVAPDGTPMPVAARRLPARGFPLYLVLGDDDSPMPTMKLSGLERVILGARVSGSGTATVQPGDLEAGEVIAEPGRGTPHTLRLDRRVE